MAASNMAQELIDMILPLVSGNTRDLTACSLIAKAWLAPAQKQLVTSVVLHNPPQAAKFGLLLQKRAWLVDHIEEITINYRTAVALADIHSFIAVSLPRLRVLILCRAASSPTVGCLIQPPYQECLSEFVERNLGNSTIHFRKPGINDALDLPFFCNASQLQLKGTIILDLGYLCRCMAQFIRLTSIHLERVGWNWKAESVLDTAWAQSSCIIPLRTLSLCGTSSAMTEICTWVGTGSQPQLTDFKVDITSIVQIEMRYLARNLRTLNINCDGGELQPDAAAQNVEVLAFQSRVCHTVALSSHS
jgi:hypothetical protein